MCPLGMLGALRNRYYIPADLLLNSIYNTSENGGAKIDHRAAILSRVRAAQN